VQREDDREETVRRRLDVYHRQTEPLVQYYEERGLLQRFDGTLSPEEVHGHIRSTLVTLRMEEDA
jgi:adenylate kinase